VHRDDDDRQIGQVVVDPAGGLDAVEHGHRHVHHHDVGVELSRETHGLAAVAGLGHHRHAGFFEGAPDRLAQELMIVREEYPHQGVPFVVTRFLRSAVPASAEVNGVVVIWLVTATSTATRVPRTGARSIVMRAPIASARSRIPTRP